MQAARPARAQQREDAAGDTLAQAAHALKMAGCAPGALEEDAAYRYRPPTRAPKREDASAMPAPPDLSRCERCGRSLPPSTHPDFSRWTIAKDDDGKVSGIRCPSCQGEPEADH